MKRATLTAYPSPQLSHPADLTDRLLEEEATKPAEPAGPSRRGSKAGTKRTRRAVKPRVAQPVQPQREPAGPANLEAALAAAAAATRALQEASREAPARYAVALHYRLDALAHHLQQVKEFIEGFEAGAGKT